MLYASYKAEVKKIIDQEWKRRQKIQEEERDARAKIYAQILTTLPTVDLSGLAYKTWAEAARSFGKRFAKFGAEVSIEPRSSVSLWIEWQGDEDDADEETNLSVDVLFEEYGQRLAYDLSVGVSQEKGFEFPLNGVPPSLPFPEGKYPTEQNYWAEFLNILTAGDQLPPPPTTDPDWIQAG
jgi:hypothetical protein